MIRIALDGSGGDQAPDAPIDGALRALQDFPDSVKLTLVGRRAEVAETLEVRPILEGIDIVDAPDIVGMAERPLHAVRSKRKSSVIVGSASTRVANADAFRSVMSSYVTGLLGTSC